jgi:arylsulfatase A-like enzyme
VDDLRYDYTSFNGSKLLKTPNVDKLAETGVYFGSASCQGMMCGPSRNSLITGLYPHNLGFYINGELKALPKGVWTFPKALQRAGYYTAWIGKCHVRPGGGKNKTLAMEKRMGFDFVEQTLGRVMLCKKLKQGKDLTGDWYIEHLIEKGELEEFKKSCESERSTMGDSEYLDGFFTKNAEEFIANYDQKKPMFLWLNYTLPHGPFDVPEQYHKPFKPEDMPGFTDVKNYTEPAGLVKKTKVVKSEQKIKEYQAGYLANIVFLDKQVGQVVEALKKKGIYDNTVIVFFSDHGLMMGDHHRIHKGTRFLPVTNPGLIISWPAKMKQNYVVEDPVELIDLINTTLSLAGADQQDLNKREYSVNLLPALYDGKKVDRKYAFGEIEGYVMVTDGKYRLIKGKDVTLLFDDKKDPHNLEDIADKHPEIVKKMSKAIDDWFKETGKPLPPHTY